LNLILVAKRILIIGCSGWGNIGDELILDGILHDVSALGNVVVASRNKELSEEIHKGVDFVEYPLSNRSLRTLFSFAKECLKSDIVILGGGYLLHDQTWYNLFILTAFVVLMRLFGKKVLLYGVGGGPIKKNVSKTLLRLMSRLSVISVRDGFSLREVSKGAEKVVLTADPGFRLLKDFPKKRKYGKKTLGISICAWLKNTNYWKYGKKAPEREMKAFVSFLEKLIRKLKVKEVVFLPLYMPFDKDVSERIKDSLLRKNEDLEVKVVDLFYDLEEIKKQFSQVDLLLGMRLHSLIIASMCGTPFMAMVYDDKVRSFCEDINYTYFIEMDDIYENEIPNERIEELLKKRREMGKLLLKESERFYELARRNVDLLRRWL